MKKTLLAFIIFHSFCLFLAAQKKAIDNFSHETWDQLGSYNISNNGKYAWYKNSTPISSPILNIVFLKNSYKISFPNAEGDPAFTFDNSHLIFKAKGALNILNLKTKKNQCIEAVGDIQVSHEGPWMSYTQNGDLILKNLSSGYEKKYSTIDHSLFNDQGTTLLLQSKGMLTWISLKDMSERIIARDSTYNSLQFDKSGTKITYISNSNKLTLKYFGTSMVEAQSLTDPAIINIPNEFEISSERIWFSNNGDRIFFTLKKKETTKNNLLHNSSASSKINLWHYKDEILKSAQLHQLSNYKPPTYTAVFAIKQKNLELLETDKHTLVAPPGEKYALTRTTIDESELYWKKSLISYELISIADGTKQPIVNVRGRLIPISMSPTERFILWYDSDKNAYFSYEISTRITRNISSAIAEPLFVDNKNRAVVPSVGIAGWIHEDSAVLIYDRYDIWKVDPLAHYRPINITSSLGKKNNLAYRIALNQAGISSIKSSDSLLLVSLNLTTKENSFWKLPMKNRPSPVMCSVSSFLYYFPDLFIGAPNQPIKAQYANVFMATRCNANQSPNLVITTDFRTFKQISDIAPQREYNWMTSELIRWKMLDGNIGEGILYRPENFDSTKKYPIIFHYYEKRSNELNKFHIPFLSAGDLNIPWYVSNGYLVFIPDIRSTPGRPGDAAANSVISAGLYFAQKNWVDSSTMGLQGHSYGGYETNYIITKTNIFSAAQSSSGLSDLPSEYGSLGFGAKSLTFMAEVGQLNLRKTPWEDPLLYIRNSPIFFSNKIGVPLLLMHNQGDDVVPFSQSLELFISLRRQEKPVWLLQYDGDGHILSNFYNQLDFNIKQQQFFDHFLKHTPAPKWLKESTSVRDKD